MRLTDAVQICGNLLGGLNVTGNLYCVLSEYETCNYTNKAHNNFIHMAILSPPPPRPSFEDSFFPSRISLQRTGLTLD